MKLEDKVCTLEQSKRIVELGVVLETEKVWIYLGRWYVTQRHNAFSEKPLISAPDVTELVELLGKYYNWIKIQFDSDLGYITRLKQPGLIHVTSNMDHWVTYEKTEAQARAAAYIWLKENEYIKPAVQKLDTSKEDL